MGAAVHEAMGIFVSTTANACMAGHTAEPLELKGPLGHYVLSSTVSYHSQHIHISLVAIETIVPFL